MFSRRIAVVMMAVFLSSWGYADDNQVFDTVLLSPESRQQLPPAAAEAYRQAVLDLDHINYIQAIENFAKAAQAAPRHEELQFLTVKFAIQRARVTFAEESLKYYAIAEAALQHILDLPHLKDEDRQRAQLSLEVVRNEKARVYERDSKRNTVGKIIIDERAKMMYPEVAMTPEAAVAAEPTATPPVFATPYPQPGQPGYQQPYGDVPLGELGYAGAGQPPPANTFTPDQPIPAQPPAEGPPGK